MTRSKESSMEISALLYIMLTVAAVGFALLIDNKEYVPQHLSGRRPVGCNRQQGRNLVAEGVIYCLLAGVSAFRVAIGRDYWVYWYNFKLIAQDRHVSYEPGFRYVVKLMQAIFGADTYKPIFFLFSVLTVFFFLKSIHDQGKWYAASLYLLLTGGYYFSSMHNVRYYFALAIAMYSAKYVLRGEYGKFILWILLASGFHKSVLIVIPAYLVAGWLSRIQLKKWHYVAGGVLTASLILGQDLYRKIIFYFYPYYENSEFDTGEISWVNVAKCLGTIALSIICWKRGMKEDKANRFYFFLNLAGLIVYTCGSFIPEVSRIGFYLTIFQIFLIANLLQSMKKGKFKVLCILGAGGVFALYFLVFLYRAYDDSVGLLPYNNWIFH